MNNNSLINASKIRSIYTKGYEFPKWSISKKLWKLFNFEETYLLYHKSDNIKKVKKLLKYREPCNIAMKNYYNKNKLKKEFGWSEGAYSLSTPKKLMPNIAILCHAHIFINSTFYQVYVINLIGFAYDSCNQPDYIYCKKQLENGIPELKIFITHYTKMWEFAYYASKKLYDEGKIDSIMLYNVGGGVFSGKFYKTFIKDIFEPSFIDSGILDKFIADGITILGYDFIKKDFNGPFIPDTFKRMTIEKEHCLYVNAWDPWSIIGNGNNNDNSLDGYWGRCSNMAVLGWSLTNPSIRFLGI
jgi:hypothetical protein